MSRQTFEHVSLELHSICLHIKMFGIQCPSQPTDTAESGSDECEKQFRSFGGFSRSGGRRRNYNILEALDAAGDEISWVFGRQRVILSYNFSMGVVISL